MLASVDLTFLRASDLFENQPEEFLRAVLAQGRVQEFGPGAVVFRQGDRGDRLYIVKAGVLEVVAAPADGSEPVPLAYLGIGEVIGELALLTGSPRTATLRCPERAELFTLDKTVFMDLMETLPAFSRSLCLVLARRLEVATHKLPGVSTKQLQGNLRFFDLPTVIQTLIGSHQTGSLTIVEEGGKQGIAEMFFFKGNVARAKVKHLTGDDAVFQLFQSPIEGEFSFTGRHVQEDEVQCDVTLPGISLLMEAVRLQDELQLLMERFPERARIYRQKTTQLEWENSDTLELGVAVWSRLKKGGSIADLHHEVPRCSYHIYRTVATLLDTDQIQ